MEKVRIKDKMRSAYSPIQWLGVQIERIREFQFEESIGIENWEVREAIYKTPYDYEWLSETWQPYRIGDEWGGENHTAFFRCDLKIPHHFHDKYGVLRLKPGGEGLLRIDEAPFAGLDTKHATIYLSDHLEAGKTYHMEIEQTVNEMEIPVVLHRFSLAELAILDRDTEDAYFDFKCLYDITLTNQAATDVVQFIFSELKKAVALIDFETGQEKFKSGLSEAKNYLADNIYNSGRYKFEGRLNMVGHSHLDLVYQWDYNEFLRKIGRTHSTTLNVMREFPEYLFCQSQLKLYEDLKHLYPEIYAGIKQRVKDNRWEVIGGMYIEPDCNLISGESFVRQLLVGNQIAEREFGTTSNICWLPDVFGISWFVPQILQRTGYKYLITNKPVIWNDTNEMPHNTFWWEGPDGSKIMVHLPATHFGAKIDVDVMLTNWNEYKQKIECSEAIYNYGYADGRGGPNRDDILKGLRYKHTPGVPESDFTHGQEAFERMESTVEKLPVLKNELYLETHRGTYTTQARLKKNNRKAEILFKNAEFLSAMMSLKGLNHPKSALDEGWKLVLKNQFHDILPGSHVNSAYHDAIDDYKTIFDQGEKVLHSSLDYLLGQNNSGGTKLLEFMVFNTQPWERSDMVEVDLINATSDPFIITDPDGSRVDYQVLSKDMNQCKLLVDVQNVPAAGYAVFKIEEGTSDLPRQFHSEKNCIENDFFELAIDQEGDISELYDKKNRRFVVEKGSKANKFQLFEDVPGKYAAWDIVPMYKDCEVDMPPVEKTEIIENGAIRIVIRQERKFYNSEIIQHIVLYKNQPRIDFETEINWQERDRLLKVSFPVAVNSMYATYDLSYGYIERPTHQNTSWDVAKFEVCGHMWADLSEGDYGVSLLNDCKYGHDILGNEMRLTLLKGPQYPDPKADFGKHSFTYSLFPHQGGWREAQVPRRAWELNDKLMGKQLSTESGELVKTNSFFEVDKDYVMVSAIKLAEDGNGIIIRLYEDQNRRGEVNISFNSIPISAVECDPFEKKTADASIVDHKLQFYIKPFEIRTFRILL